MGRSVMSIVSGYLALFSVLLVPAPLALLTGIHAIREIRGTHNSPDPKHGMGRAVFGIIMGTLGTIALIAIFISSLS